MAIEDEIKRLFGGFSQAIRLGRGVLGKTASVAAISILVLGLIALRLSGVTPLLVVAGAVVGVAVIYLGLAFAFAFKNPGAALLEGSDLLQWQQTSAGLVSGIGIDMRVVSDPLALEHQPEVNAPAIEDDSSREADTEISGATRA